MSDTSLIYIGKALSIESVDVNRCMQFLSLALNFLWANVLCFLSELPPSLMNGCFLMLLLIFTKDLRLMNVK